MFEKLKQKIKDAIDPSGPIGQWLSPSVTFKERQGLPTSNPRAYVQRVQLETSAQVERALAPSRFVELGVEEPPAGRKRILSAFVEEEWAPIYATAESDDLHAILAAGQTQIGWKVQQRVRSAYCDCTKARFSKQSDGSFMHEACGRARRHLSDEEFVEIVASQQIQATDEFYNGFYPTIPGGNDPVIMDDGSILRGTPTYDKDGKMIHDGIIRGTYIKRGRREYNQKTASMVHWDAGTIRERERALADESSRPIRNVRRELERLQGEALPMRRLLPNARRDRSSAC